ncbi:hypothetical protein KY330_02800 [Candidatus Woesearchaeota archaeon]|nr:hypothetical protein [Candidatus Woesearchaeota archaeon]
MKSSYLKVVIQVVIVFLVFAGVYALTLTDYTEDQASHDLLYTDAIKVKTGDTLVVGDNLNVIGSLNTETSLCINEDCKASWDEIEAVLPACIDGQVVKYDVASGSWVCSDDEGGVAGGGFGTIETRNPDTVYQAETDGFVVATFQVPTTQNSNLFVIGYADSNSNPTAIRAREAGTYVSDSAWNYHGSITMPVKAGEYWKVVGEVQPAGLTASSYIYWVPLSGSGVSGGGDLPIGTISPFYLSTCPEGWSLADGTDGTPDLRDRFIVGAGSSYALGDTGGEDYHTLTIAEMPSHTHIYNQVVQPGSAWWVGSGGVTTGLSSTASGPAGGSAAHENRPPFYALIYCMKTSSTSSSGTSGGADADWTIEGDNMYSAVTGNVGIGTSTPAEKLDVAGNVKLTGKIGTNGYSSECPTGSGWGCGVHTWDTWAESGVRTNTLCLGGGQGTSTVGDCRTSWDEMVVTPSSTDGVNVGTVGWSHVIGRTLYPTSSGVTNHGNGWYSYGWHDDYTLPRPVTAIKVMATAQYSGVCIARIYNKDKNYIYGSMLSGPGCYNFNSLSQEGSYGNIVGGCYTLGAYWGPGPEVTFNGGTTFYRPYDFFSQSQTIPGGSYVWVVGIQGYNFARGLYHIPAGSVIQVYQNWYGPGYNGCNVYVKFGSYA